MEQQDKTILQTVAHDLKNPIAALKGYLELIANTGPLNDKQQHFLNRSNLAVQEMSDLTERLLDMAWIDAGMPFEFYPMRLNTVVQEVITRYQEWAQQQNIQLIPDLADVPPVRADARFLKQVVVNLVENAIKYSPNGGEVLVKVAQVSPELVEFSVQDQGMGIPAEYLPHVFERFFRVPGEPGSRKVKGTGIGLFICHDVIRQHGQELKATSEFGKGSRFSFTLPIAPETQPD